LSAPAAEARVDLKAIHHNVRVLREHAGAAELMAVVKADGYGHGLLPTARAALHAGATWLGTATIGEALTLRAAGLDCRILSWLNAPGAAWSEAVGSEIDLSASDRDTISRIAHAAQEVGRTASLHLEIDSGLGRGGASIPDWPALVAAALRAQAAGVVSIVGLWSHLGSSDDPRGATARMQLKIFEEAVDTATRMGATPQVRHLANSAATLLAPDTHFDLVRPGIALYGLWPDIPYSAADLRPAMTLIGRLSSAKRVPAGQGVSYGHDYVTARDTVLGLVPLGYADGVPRRAGGAITVLAAGRRHRIAGRVSMDQFVVDLGQLPAAAGDEVILFGPGDKGEPTVADWACALGTISQEIVTAVGPRVERTYR
jgi:alanine racemase